MTDYSRRKFLKQIGAVAVLCLTNRTAFSLPGCGGGQDFEMLVVGDSLIAGQGLKKENKFSTLVENWLEEEFFGGKRQVNLKNKSHSGARIFLADEEKKALEKAGLESDKFYHPEINLSFPSIKTQIDVAAAEYKTEGREAGDINLIMLSGGITNINSSYILNPFKKNKPLREKIERYCHQAMFEFLQHAAETFPNALITVIGYFPMVSKKSSSGEIYNAILELYEIPRPTKPVFNNILTKQLFKIMHHKMNKRSRIWLEGSNKALETAIGRLNKKHGEKKAVFVRSPITEDRCFGTKNSLLWGMAKKGRAEDDLYDERIKVCGETIGSLEDLELKFKTRFCELSGIGHPNVEGSKAYAEAIQETLRENSKLLFFEREEQLTINVNKE